MAGCFRLSRPDQERGQATVTVGLLRQAHHDHAALLAGGGNQVTAGRHAAIGGYLHEQLDFLPLDHDIAFGETGAFDGQFARIRCRGAQVGVGRGDAALCVDFQNSRVAARESGFPCPGYLGLRAAGVGIRTPYQHDGDGGQYSVDSAFHGHFPLRDFDDWCAWDKHGEARRSSPCPASPDFSPNPPKCFPVMRTSPFALKLAEAGT